MAPPKPDFKRIKAKVGKRAPRPANETDTSFRAASLHLAQQHSIVDHGNKNTLIGKNHAGHAEDELISSRGRSLTDLVAQSQHPAGAVRISAAKGLQDIILMGRNKDVSCASEEVSVAASTSTSTSTSIVASVLQRHFSLLAQVTARCCVDEESEVRTLGLHSFQLLLQMFDASAVLRPFVHLWITFALSALNSLDRDIRLDGAQAVALLSQKAPTLVQPYLFRILPAFVRLLADFRIVKRQTGENSSNTNSNSNKKKKKRKRTDAASSTNTRQFSVLQALVALLETTKEEVGQDNNSQAVQGNNQDVPDLLIAPNGRSCHALVIINKNSRLSLSARPVRALRSLSDLPPWDTTTVVNSPDHDSSAKTVMDLVSKLRDKFVELTQRAHSFNEEGLRLAWEDLESVHQVVRSLRLLHHYSLSSSTTLLPNKQTEKLASLLLDNFPFFDDGSAKSHAADTNTEICLLLALMADNHEKGRKWMKAVANHVQNTFNKAVDENPISTQTLQVLRHLLMRARTLWKSTDIMPHTLTALLCSAFFSESVVGASLAQSEAGRCAVVLVADLLRDKTVQETQQLYGTEILKATVDYMPQYLMHWGGDYFLESIQVLNLLQDFARRMTTPNDSWLFQLKKNLDPLLVGIEHYDDDDQQKSQSSCCCMEKLPAELQRRLICLVTFLGSPSEAATKALGQMCAQSLSPGVASFLIYSVHSIRKTMRMPIFLGFLLDSTGLIGLSPTFLSGEDENSAKFRKAMAMDQVIADATSCLVECGSEKVLPMIESVLQTLLSFNNAPAQTIAFHECVRARGAMAMLAVLALDIQFQNAQRSIIDILDPQLTSKVIHSTTALLLYTLGTNQPFAGNWTQPLIALLSCEELLFLRVVENLLAQLDGSTGNSTLQTNILELLLSLIQHCSLEVAIQKRMEDFLNLAQQAHGMFPDGPFEDLSGRIVSHLQVAQKVGPSTA